MGRGGAHFVGIELSGAAFAGLDTWVATGRVDGEALVVESVQQLAGVASVAERDPAMIGLAAWLAKQRNAVVAIRAPFGLPAPVVTEPSWRAFAASFPGRWPTPEQFIDDFGGRTAGRFLQRVTDRLHRLLTAPYKRRVGYQTWANLHHVVGPLVAADRAVAAPMQARRGGVPVLVETHVGAAIRARRIAPPFTGALEVSRQSRRAALDRLSEGDGLEFASAAVRDVLVRTAESGALDSVVAATVAGRLARQPELLYPGVEEAAAIEGHVYV